MNGNTWKEEGRKTHRGLVLPGIRRARHKDGGALTLSEGDDRVLRWPKRRLRNLSRAAVPGLPGTPLRLSLASAFVAPYRL